MKLKSLLWLLFLIPPALAQTGIIRTVAGTGANDFAGDGGQAQNADLYFPAAVAVDASGNIYIADATNNRVRRIAAQGVVTGDGIITTFAGNGNAGSSGDGGQATAASLNRPYGLAVDKSGNVYISELNGNRVRKVTPAGVISTFAGTGSAGFGGDNGPATSAQLTRNTTLAIDSSGNLFIADGGNNRVRKVTPGGIISTVAGSGATGNSGDGGSAVLASITAPTGVAVDASGNLYISSPSLSRVRKVDSSGVITAFAGTGAANYSGDGGPATAATLNNPYSLATDAGGNVYIGELTNNVVRKVSNGIISTVAGSGGPGSSGDGGDATAAFISGPYGLLVDASGGIFIADAPNNNVRLVTYPPVFTVNNVVLGAGFTPGAIVPGSIFSVFGSGFARAPIFPASLPTAFLADVQVIMNGLAMPEFYADSQQINFQASTNLVPGQNVTFGVRTNTVGSKAVSIPVVAVRPGIFTLGGAFGNQGAILLANSNQIAMPATAGVPSGPVRSGDTISIFCTGMGATNPAVPSGAVTPTSSLASVTTKATVTIGGIDAPVSFAGLAPGFVGLYQVNAQVPAGVPPGNAVPVVVTQAGTASNTATIAVQ